MKKLLTLLFTLLTVLPTLSHAQSEGQVPDAVEYAALKAIYEATGGDNWTKNNNWLQGSTSADFGTWHGVQVRNGDVYHLYLNSNNLTGSIPAEIGDLTNMKGDLFLSSNNLTGNIPAELGNLVNLTRLSLNNNNLSGSIPAELGSLASLTYFSLQQNDLTGSIPAELGNLANLTGLDLRGNDLTGSIPAELGELANLTSLWLSHNGLTSSIPAELGNLGNLANLTSLDLNNNNLTGSIPIELGNLANLASLDLWDNNLTGSIPAELGELANLTWLDLNNNNLTGSIPIELGNLANLTRLGLNNNNLTGSIPAELSKLANLEALVLYSNQFKDFPDFRNSPNKSNLQIAIMDNIIDLNYIAANLSGVDTHPFKDFLYSQNSLTDTIVIADGATIDLNNLVKQHPQTSYQWQHFVNGSWQGIEGATQPTYQVPGNASATLYRCQLTNNWLPGMQQYSTVFKLTPGSVATQVWLEAECAEVIGSAWLVKSNPDASAESYLEVVASDFHREQAPTASSAQVRYTFSISEAGQYRLFTRHLAYDGDDDSFWVRINNGEWINAYLGAGRGSWVWAPLGEEATYVLSAGSHSITVAYREPGARLDKLYLTLDGGRPTGTGTAAGNCTTPQPPSSTEQGVRYAYYKDETENWSALPDFTSLSPEKEGILDNFSLAPAEQADHYGFVYTTYLEVDQGGEYTFYLLSDDGSQLLVEGEQVVSYDGRHSATEEQSGRVVLSAGRHKLKIRYFEYRYKESLQVSYRGPGISKQIIPSGVLFLEDDASPPPTSANLWLEAECASSVGSAWQTEQDSEASNGKYLVYPVSGRSLESVPTNPSGQVVFSINVANPASYYLQALIRAPDLSRNSFWFRVDNGKWIKWWEDITLGEQFAWNTAPGGPLELTAGTHTITFAYREGGTQLDKLYLNTNGEAPDGLGDADDACAQPLTEIIIDNADPGFSTTGIWNNSTQQSGNRYGSNYVHDGNTGKGSKTATFSASVTSGTYEVYGWWSSHSNRATNVPFDVIHDCGTTTTVANQRINGASWQLLGTYTFDETAQVTLRTDGTDGYVIADAIRLVPSSATVEPCLEEPYNPPTPPSIVNNPPDGSTAPAVGGSRPASQSNSNVNYVRSFTSRALYDQPSQVTLAQSVSDVQVSTEYLDGLGRPIQTVVRGGSGSVGQDLVQPVAYDAFGRQTKQYLPYAASGASGAYRPNGLQAQYDFYTAPPSNVARSGYAYAETKFEPSPLNRPVEQTAPGENWRIGSGHEVETDYLVNTGGEVRQWTAGNLTSTSLSTAKNYDAGTLYKTVVTDENGHTTTEFRDKLDQVVLKRVQGPDGDLNTYYVYDDYNLLRFVLPPEASRQLSGNTSLASNADFRQKYLFVYDYDNRRRMSSKQVPGGGTTTMKYDQWDRLALSQSALQASKGQWSFTKYDQLNRPIITGVTTSSAVSGSRFETKNGSTVGYTLSGSPHSVSEAQVRTVTYYDDYSFPHAGSYGFSDNIAARSFHPDVHGQMTGSKTRNLDDNSWLNSVTYYDEQYRVIQTYANNHLGGKDRITTTYRNAVNSEMTASKRVHSSNSGPTRTITQNYGYDHTGRLTQVTHQWEGQPAMTLSAQQYNAIGELVNKQLGASTPGNSQQAVDYRYNIRGWLTRINDLTSSNRYFNQELYYDFGFDKKQHNGNISGIRWNRAGGKAHAYGYLYDEVNRITGADYRAKPLSGSWATQPGNFTVDKVAYDLNGNITDLKRYGEQDERQYLWDNLEYKYDGNRLRAVGELAEGQAEVGFVDGVAGSATVEYGYDLSGNMTADANKGISSITYDPVLNLPTEVVITGKGTIKYTYDAAGTKLRQEVLSSDGSPAKTTDYVSGFHYTDGTLDFVQHEEGRLMIKDGLAYHYDLKDHLGNTRVTFSNVPVTTTTQATMEASAAPVEEAVFEGVAESRQTLAFHNTTDASIQEPEPQQVATLMPGEQGPSKSLQVHSGDTVRLKVNARYETTPQQVQGLGGVATEVVGAVEKTASGLESSGVSEGINGLGATGALANDQQEAPQAYLNYLVYDEDYQLVDQGFVAVSEAAAVGAKNPDAAPEELALEVPIEEDGFVYAYLSNGVANSSTPVHFDDFTVEQQSYIVQVSDLYPFGLTHQQPLPNQLPNKYLFQGQERQLDLGLNWDQFKWRMHDPAIGRFTTIDPLAHDYVHNSPYAFSENKVISHVELEGLEAVFFQAEARVSIGVPALGLLGVTTSTAVGVAADFKGNVGVYTTVSAGPQVGIGGTLGLTGGVNLNAEDIYGLEGYGFNIGGFVTPMIAGFSFSGEVNFAIETDMNEQNGFPPNTEGKINSGGVSIGIPGASAGFGGSVYGDASFTYMTASGNVVDAIDGVVKKFESALGEIGVTPQDIGIKDTKGFIQSMYQQAIDQSTKEEDED